MISAEATGRISHLWNHLLLGLPFAADKVWFYKLFQYGTILFDIGALYLLLSRHFDKKLATLSSVIAMAFLSISHWHIDSDYRTDSLKVITPLLNSLQAIVVATSDGGTVRFENVKNGDILNVPEGLYFDMSKNPMR